jgi:hypothetical protein
VLQVRLEGKSERDMKVSSSRKDVALSREDSSLAREGISHGTLGAFPLGTKNRRAGETSDLSWLIGVARKEQSRAQKRASSREKRGKEMEDDSKFRFGGLRDAVDDFIDEFEEVGEQHGTRSTSAEAAATSAGDAPPSAGDAGGTSSTTANQLSPWGFVMMSEEERLELVHRLQAAASTPPPSLHLRWRLSHPSPSTPPSAQRPQEQQSSGTSPTGEEEEEAGGGEEVPREQTEQAFEEEEEVRLADEGRDQTWTFTTESLSFSVRPPPFIILFLIFNI